MSERKIGQILSTSGIIFAVSQYFIQSFAYNQFGLYGSIRTGAILCAPMVFLVPVSLLINRGYSPSDKDDQDAISPFTFAYLCIVLALSKTFLLVFFANISVAINRTIFTDSRAALNGLSILGSSVAKGLGPSFAGVTATLSVAVLGKFGSLLMFGSVGFVASLVAIASVLYLKEDPEHECHKDISIEMVEATQSEPDEA